MMLKNILPTTVTLFSFNSFTYELVFY